jgi:hypothetical protein
MRHVRVKLSVASQDAGKEESDLSNALEGGDTVLGGGLLVPQDALQPLLVPQDVPQDAHRARGQQPHGHAVPCLVNCSTFTELQKMIALAPSLLSRWFHLVVFNP